MQETLADAECYRVHIIFRTLMGVQALYLGSGPTARRQGRPLQSGSISIHLARPRSGSRFRHRLQQDKCEQGYCLAHFTVEQDDL